jgi:hypothetical protein
MLHEIDIRTRHSAPPPPSCAPRVPPAPTLVVTISTPLPPSRDLIYRQGRFTATHHTTPSTRRNSLDLALQPAVDHTFLSQGSRALPSAGVGDHSLIWAAQASMSGHLASTAYTGARHDGNADFLVYRGVLSPVSITLALGDGSLGRGHGSRLLPDPTCRQTGNASPWFSWSLFRRAGCPGSRC